MRQIDPAHYQLAPSWHWAQAPALLERLRRLGARPASLAEVIDTADREARPLAPGEPPLAALPTTPAWGFAWDERDALTDRWYPQGITTSHDAAPDGRWQGREVLLVSWALDGHRSVRVSFAEIGATTASAYRHVLLVEPVRALGGAGVDLRPIRLHAGGIAWRGPYLHVADTLRGLRVFDLRELVEVATGREDVVGVTGGRPHAAGHRYALPQVGAYRLPILRTIALWGPRFSFISLGAGTRAGPGSTPALLAGEYRKGKPGARLVSWPLAEDASGLLAVDRRGRVRACEAWTTDRTNLQGALRIGDRVLLASSAGRRRPGSVAVFADDVDAAAPCAHPWAVGPEDLTYAPGRDLVLSLTEHPPDQRAGARGGRVVFGIRASDLDLASGST